MKKLFSLLFVLALMLTMAAPAFAAATGEWTDKTLEIAGLPTDKAAEQTKMEKGKNNVVDFSESGTTDVGTKGHRMTYEYNQDLLDTVLLKQDNDRNPNLTEYITYKMDKTIAGFELDVLCCAGLGDPLEDLTIFISKTGADGSWAQIKTQATYYEFDPNYYIVWDKAYWFHSTLTNAQKIPTGYKYLKIQFNPCNDQGDVPWNVAVDDVKVILGTNVDPVTIPEDKKFVDWETINAEREATKTTQNNNNATTAPTNNKTTAPTGGNNNTTLSGNNNTTLGGGSNNTTTSINDNGEVVTDPTTTATDANGEVITDPTNTDGTGTVEDGSNADGDTANDNANSDGGEDGNTNTDADPVKKGNALPWIIGGAVVLAGAAAAVYFLVIKKKN